MLSQLYIENIAVIEKVCIDFGSGLNILTGETGAGKSVLINAIGSIIGRRTPRDVIRTNTEKALVISKFEKIPDKLHKYLENNNFINKNDNSVLVERDILASGRTNCKINLKPVTMTVLKDIGRNLITIHGQNDSYDLLSKDLHIKYIDNLAQNQSLLKEYQDEFKKLIEIKRKMEALSIDEDKKLRTIDLLRYQINELEDADLKEEEYEELNRKKQLYSNSEKIMSSLSDAYELISDENIGILQNLQSVVNNILSIKDLFPEISNLSNRLSSLYYELDDCKEEMNAFIERIEYNPNELEDIELRLDLIYKLSRKYGATIKDMLIFLEKCKKDLNEMALSEESMQNLKKAYEHKLDIVSKLAEKLSFKRKQTAQEFCKKIKTELKFLDMPNIEFEVFQNRSNLNIYGYDEIQFLISTNPGEIPKPLSKIASGGELSRIMLAMKTVLANNDTTSTLIFDEVDAGISGSAAQKVGQKLKELSKHHQVICITHSAQIAAFADEHFLIKKEVKDNRSYTSINQLNFTQRQYEIARIISGAKPTETILNTASEMINNAKEYKMI